MPIGVADFPEAVDIKQAAPEWHTAHQQCGGRMRTQVLARTSRFSAGTTPQKRERIPHSQNITSVIVQDGTNISKSRPLREPQLPVAHWLLVARLQRVRWQARGPRGICRSAKR
jgi:hypothetical protein